MHERLQPFLADRIDSLSALRIHIGVFSIPAVFSNVEHKFLNPICFPLLWGVVLIGNPYQAARIPARQPVFLHLAFRRTVYGHLLIPELHQLAQASGHQAGVSGPFRPNLLRHVPGPVPWPGPGKGKCPSFFLHGYHGHIVQANSRQCLTYCHGVQAA